MRYHLMMVRRTIIKKSTNSKCREKGTLFHCWWGCKFINIRRENHNSKRYMHPNVHCCIVYNSQDMEALYMSINKGMGTEGTVYMYNVILFRYKKKWNCVIFKTGMNLETIKQSEVSQKEKNIICHLYVESRKMILINLFAKQK